MKHWTLFLLVIMVSSYFATAPFNIHFGILQKQARLPSSSLYRRPCRSSRELREWDKSVTTSSVVRSGVEQQTAWQRTQVSGACFPLGPHPML